MSKTGPDAIVPPGREVVVVAHRGLAPGFPENTLAAFRNVIARGVGVIELDLRGTADGEIVIMHDETVDRTTDGTGAVGALTLAEIRALDAGAHAGAAFAGERVPTYAEALALAKSAGITLLHDIKESPMLDRARVVRLTEAHDATANVIAGVRTLADLHAVRVLSPTMRTLGFIAAPPLIEPFAAAGVDIIRLWPDWIAPDRITGAAAPAEATGTPTALIDRVRALGKPAWTTAGPAPREALLALIRMGIDGILTDTPDVLATLLTDIDAARGR